MAERPIRYLPLLEELDRWQKRTSAELPGVIPCKAGCSSCCNGPFDISVADVETLLVGVASLPPVERAEVEATAAEQVARMVALEPEWGPPFDIAAIGEGRFDRVSDSLANLPCPLLDSARNCRIYAHRPMVCRLMGLGMVTEHGDVIENGCPIKSDFPEYEALPPQPFPLEAWELHESNAISAAAVRLLGSVDGIGYETTIAAAITIWRGKNVVANI